MKPQTIVASATDGSTMTANAQSAATTMNADSERWIVRLNNLSKTNTKMNNEQTEYEYLCVEVTRSERTQIYLKAPNGWRPSGNDKALGRAAKETTTEDDWEKFGWERSVELQSHKPVSAEEASQFKVFDVIKFNENNPTK